MIKVIVDTHALLWYLYQDRRLSKNAESFIDTLLADNNDIGISSITLVEVVYLIEKATVSTDALERILSALNDDESRLVEVAVDQRLIASMRKLPRKAIPDMPDRIIAATALHLKVPLISRDGKITVSGIQTIW